MPRLPRSLAAIFLLALATVFAKPAAAAWPNDPAINVPVCFAANDEQLSTQAICSDGAGGVIIAWQDNRGYYDIYAQRISAAGFPLWTANGVPVCTAANYQDRPSIVADGAGGALIVWSDARTAGVLGYDVYAQHLNSAGVAQWTADGVPVCNLANDQFALGASVVADGAGGVIVSWYDYRNIATTGYDIYAQRLNASGVAQWGANGVPVCNAADTQILPIAVADGTGGAIFAWNDYRTTATTGNDIYAQRVNGAGIVQWAANGIPICNLAGDQSGISIAADGSGGAIVSWIDYRSGNNYDVYAQRVTATGAQLWTANGAAVCVLAGTQQSAALTADGSGGAIIAWEDYRSGNADIYAQHLGAGGSPMWVANGVALTSNPYSQGLPVMTSDGSGGAEIAWQDTRNGNSSNFYDIYAQRVNSSGATLWMADGIALTTAASRQQTPSLTSDANGTLIAAFMDLRNGLNYHISAQRVEQFGKLGNPEPVITSVLDVPNDQGGHVRLSWAPSYLDPANDYDMSVYDIYHSIPPNLAQQAQQAVRTGAAREVRAGEAPLAGRPSYLFTSQGTQAYAWEYVNSVNPTHFLTSYGSNQATTGDSVGGSNPTTAFMVVARGYTGKYWLSVPASGYSVDNLPPKTPAPFTGQYAAGSTKLHWDRNTEADLAGYKLYRGSNAAFIPSAANLVSTLADTGYVDAAAAPYIYKLTAVDSHGNESPVATLTPTGTLGVGDGAAITLAFAAPSPNPAHGATTLEFTLAQAGHVRLSVFDAAGRRVQMLHDGEMAAGAHREAFALRDDAGRDLAAGLYLVRLETAGRVITRRLAAVR